ncbi:hypothetical protein PUN28_016825 [Cardiocondyla obscurior]|uniref:Uncharacterized protein n=1 Tax=Cardiocondyla obscurior TaxID=286306 RepID=A0AAW2ESR6_9HYME
MPHSDERGVTSAHKTIEKRRRWRKMRTRTRKKREGERRSFAPYLARSCCYSYKYISTKANARAA